MTARPRVLVTDASRGSAVAVIRSLGRRGWHVTAADPDRLSPGLRSRYASTRLVYPDPSSRSDAMVDTLASAAHRERIDLVIPVTDEVGLPLAAARAAFPSTTRLALPDDGPLAIVHDKARTMALAAELGVPTPSTIPVVDGDDALRAAAELGWPVVVKPASSRLMLEDGTVEAFTVSYAADPAALREAVKALDGRTGILLQRWRPGDGVGVELLAHEGRPLAAFQHRRLREVPVTGGASSLRESVPVDRVLLDYSTRLLGALRWTGLAMVEFRSTPEGPELMEVNGRIWGSLALATRAGMDFPGRLADLLLDGPPSDETIATGYRVGVRCRNFRLEVSWIGAVATARRHYPALPWPPRWAAIPAALSLLDPRIGDDLLVRDDPLPGLVQYVSLAREMAGRWARRG